MKKSLALILAVAMMFALAACGSSNGEPEAQATGAPEATAEPAAEPTAEPIAGPAAEEAAPAETDAPAQAEEPAEGPATETGSKVLVAYFSCTGNTADVAEKIAAATGAELYEIVPEQPYTDADLDYGDNDSRTSKEQNDDSARPAISGSVENMEQYDTVFIGYPIWWGQAPKIIYTFVESYDLGGKTLVPFCTSASSGVGSSAENLHSSVSESANWLDGTRFSGGASESDIKEWVNGLELTGVGE